MSVIGHKLQTWYGYSACFGAHICAFLDIKLRERMRRWRLLSRRHGRKWPVPSLGERHVRDRTRDTKILDGATFYRHSMTVLGTPICDPQWAHICALLDITYEIEK